MPARPGCTMVTFWSWMVVVRTSISTVRIPCRERTGEYHFSVDQETRSSVSFGHWGRKGFTRSRSCRVCSLLFCWLCWVGGFSFCLPSSHPGLNCVAGPRAATGFFAGCGAGLVDAVLDRTLGVRNSVGFIWAILLIWMRSMFVWKGLPSLLNNDAYFVFWITWAPRVNARLRDYKTLFPPFFL